MTMDKPNPQNISGFIDNGQYEAASIEVALIDKGLIRPRADQVRTEFNERTIADLRDNIKSLGQIDPITVEPSPDNDGFLIVTGERRWRAIKEIEEISEIKCIVREFSSEKERFAIQLSENIDRENLSLLDKARSIEKLVKMHDGDIELAAKYIGKTRPTLIKMMSILQLPEIGKRFVDDGYTKDYSTISMLKTLCKADEKRAERLIEQYRRNQDDRPLREALRQELDQIAAKKSKPSRQKNSTIKANEIYMQDDDSKLIIVSRSGITTIKIDNLPDHVKKLLIDVFANDNTQDEEFHGNDNQ